MVRALPGWGDPLRRTPLRQTWVGKAAHCEGFLVKAAALPTGRDSLCSLQIIGGTITMHSAALLTRAILVLCENKPWRLLQWCCAIGRASACPQDVRIYNCQLESDLIQLISLSVVRSDLHAAHKPST